MTDEKGIIFCHTCNSIVGTEFPVDHNHDIRLINELLMKNLHTLGFAFYKDSPETRKFLEKNYPPRESVEIKL